MVSNEYNIKMLKKGNIEVNITDGVAYYTITSDSAETASDLQTTLSQPEVTTALDTAIEDEFPEVDVSGVNVDEEITADVVVTVDTTGAENNLNQAANELEEIFQDQGYEAEAESNIILIFFFGQGAKLFLLVFSFKKSNFDTKF